MDWFRKHMRNSICGWRRTDGRKPSRTAQSPRALGHRLVRKALKRQLATE